MKIFYSTCKPSGLYDYIINSSKIHNQKETNSLLKFKILNKINFSLSLFYFLIKVFFSKILVDEKKILQLKYKGITIGLFAFAKTLRETSSYKNSLFLKINLIKNIIFSGMIVDSVLKINFKNVEGIFIDHLHYLNGIIFSIFAKKKVKIYSILYPKEFFFINFKKKKNIHFANIENIVKICKSKKQTPLKSEILFYEKILKKPQIIPYMKKVNFSNISIDKNIKWKEFKYIIYAHSFLDAQMCYGYDGFTSLYDWLTFTIKVLVKKNVKFIVKSHPNFFNNTFGEMSKTDKYLFRKLQSEYSNKNIYYINYPVKNLELLNKISKKTILISHHGTALMEGMYLKYKCISSHSTFWNNEFKLTNTWRSRNEYKKLLLKDYQSLFYANKNDLNDILRQVFWKENCFYGSKNYLEIISNFIGISRDKLYNMQSDINLDRIKRDKLITYLSKNIEEITS